MAQSNFRAILDSRKKTDADTDKKAKSTATKKRAIRGVVITENRPPVKNGKPLAKSKDPDFIQGNFYIRKNTHAKVKIKLLQEGGEKDLSDLVEELLTKWLSK